MGVAGQGVVVLLLAATSSLYLAVAIMAVSGFFNSLFVISGMTLLQTLTPTGIRGRVVAVRMTLINSALALGSAAAGLLLLVLPYRTLWLVLGALIAASSLFVWLRPSVRGQT
jgi:MFS family permease